MSKYLLLTALLAAVISGCGSSSNSSNSSDSAANDGPGSDDNTPPAIVDNDSDGVNSDADPDDSNPCIPDADNGNCAQAPELRGAPKRFSGVAPSVVPSDVNPAPYESAFTDYNFTYNAPGGFPELVVTEGVDANFNRTSTYTVDVLGVVHYPVVAPADVPAEGFPVILFQHGRHSQCSTTGDANGAEGSGTECPDTTRPFAIRSDRGYDYIAADMAKYGYVVLSIDANDINAQDGGADLGVTARAELILHHLDIVRDLTTKGVLSDYAGKAMRFIDDDKDGIPNDTSGALEPADLSFLYNGFADMSRVGLMGHSRGGNGVAKAITFNQGNIPDGLDNGRGLDPLGFDAPHNIKGVFSLAPTDFDNELPVNTAWATLSPYCDGDVSTLHGVYMYDNVRYDSRDTSEPQFMVTTMGANHNFYNSFWFNDDAEIILNPPFDTYCTFNSPTNGRFTRPDQERHGAFLMASFLRLFVGDEQQFAPYWASQEKAPEDACPVGASECDDRLILSYHQDSADLLVIDDTLDAGSLATNNTGGSNTLFGFTLTGHCTPSGGTLDDALDLNLNRCPTNSTISKAPQIFATWSAPIQPSMSFDILAENGVTAGRDVSDFDFFSIRVGVGILPDNAIGQDFRLTMTDTSGASVDLLASDYTDSLYFPPGTTITARDTGAKTIVQMVPFNLNSEDLFDENNAPLLDMTAISNVTVTWTRPTGSIQFTDVMFQKVPYINIPD